LSGAARKQEDRVVYGLLLALGDYPREEIAAATRQPLIDKLVVWYGQDPSSAIHGATGWLLRRWGFSDAVTKIDQTPIPYDPTGEREWYTLEIKAQGSDTGGGGVLGALLGPTEQPLYFTFIVFPAGEYTIGSPDGETDRILDERLHRVTLTQPISVCDRELTWAQYDPMDNRQRHTAWERQFNRKLGQSDPVFGVNWPESVTYCCWLTAQSGMGKESQCYDDSELLPKDQEGNPQYEQIYLHRDGFRLPTEAEWEVICRSGTTTAYSFGNDVQLLGQYGWNQATSNGWSHSVGLLRPGLRGLFDTHGNVLEWCHDWGADYADGALVGNPIGPAKGSYRVYRGGCWDDPARICRAAFRLRNVPSQRIYILGFRLARVPVSQAGAEQPVREANGAGNVGP
jgi:formylglycine-generating enzyme required for sulfatase activity